MVKQHLNTLLQKEMTRKEFMATLGFGAASVMGLSQVAQMVNNGNSFLTNASSPTQPAWLKEATRGYGASVYGGGRLAA